MFVHEGIGEASEESKTTVISEGDVFFVPASASLTVKGSSSGGLLVWQATVNRAAFENL